MLLSLAVLAAGCTGSAGARRAAADPCRDLGRELPPFRPADGPALAGAYELTMLVESPAERGRVARGRIELWAPDTLFQRYMPEWHYTLDSATRIIASLDSIREWRRSGVWRPLVGAAAIDLAPLGPRTGARLASRDPHEPGLRLEGTELVVEPVRLGFAQADGNTTTLHVERAGPAGFAGRWGARFGYSVRAPNGRPVPNPVGRFCARRVE
jgi:hypothetical protein